MGSHVAGAPVPPPLDLACLTVLLLAPVPWCVAYAARQPVQSASRAATLLVLLLSWCMVQMTVAVLLGILGVLHLGVLMMSEAVVFLAGLLLTRRSPRATSLGGGALPGTWTRRLLVVGIAITGTSLLLRLATTATTDYDSLAYHLPVMARWYQTHRFTMLEQFYDGPIRLSCYPYGWEALAATFLMPFGDDFLVALPNLVAWLLFGLGIYVVAVGIGARPTAALVFTLLALTTPLAREHVEEMHVDLAFGAFFLAGVALALAPERNPVTTALFVATLGMLAGTKTSGLVYAVLLVGAFAWTRLIGRRPPTPRAVDSGARVLAGTAIVAGCLCGLFWYARNFVQMGNPLGFVHVAVAGFTLFPGPLEQERIAATTLWRQFQVTNVGHWSVVLGEAWKRLGVPFVCGLVGAFGLAPFGRRGPTRATRRDLHLLLVILLAACAIAYAMTPVSATEWRAGPLTGWMGQAMRYAFPLIGLLAAAGALALSRAPLSDEMVAPVVAVAALARASTWALAPAAALLLLGWAVHRLTRGFGPGARRVTAGCLATVLVWPGVQVLHTVRNAARARVYRGLPGFIDTAADGVLGYVLSHQSYLFYGSHFGRPVAYVPARGEDRGQWIEALRARGVRLLAMGPLRPEWRHRREVGWIEEPDGVFTLVFGQDATREPVVYRLEAGDRPGA